MEKLGIQETKELIGACIGLGEGIAKAYADDGKLSTWEGIMLTPKLFAVIKEAKDFKQILKELQDLDEDEIQELIEYVNDNFDIPQEELEQRIKAAFGIAIALIAYLIEIIN
jgi:hypothetical protein